MDDVQMLAEMAGGMGGQPFGAYVVPQGARIAEIHFLFENYVNAMQIVYASADGTKVPMAPIGRLIGTHVGFVLDRDEHIIAVSGRCGWFIDSLQIQTNKRKLDKVGGTAGDHEFALTAPADHAVVGFHGRADWHIDAFGLAVRPVAAPESPPAAATPLEKGVIAMEAAATAAESSAAATPQPKDLRRIEGIGPKIADLLIAAGIPDLAALAQADVETLREILAAAGRRYRLADPTTWPEQAALGAAGDWDGLAAFQAQLKGGRRA